MTPLSVRSSPSTLRDLALREVVRRIEEDIIFGRLAPGARLVEDRLMARHGASRHCVRQALAQLEQAGLVRREKNVGATVRSYAADEVVKIYEVRELLTRQAALMIPLPAPAGLIDRLVAIQARYRAAIDAGDLRGVHEANDGFHLVLFSACGNPYLVRTLQDYMNLTLPMRAKNLADGTGRDVSVRQHDMMIELLSGRDSWALAQLCVAHLQASKSDYLARVAAGTPAALAMVTEDRRDR
ncbi:GntR family transcriptional regulator [Rhodoplanes azumiensis]|uniref:GntR family transcriptional regulator n=1 Tax=Rhodoplanes azumiensis TaxID=1897628 RepID=A0ABW5AMH0_9BRAD